jgi:hypothetical protein
MSSDSHDTASPAASPEVAQPPSHEGAQTETAEPAQTYVYADLSAQHVINHTVRQLLLNVETVWGGAPPSFPGHPPRAGSPT